MGWKFQITDERRITYSGSVPIPKLKTEEVSISKALVNLFEHIYLLEY